MIRRILLLVPPVFLLIAFAGLLARPSDFYFPYEFWKEGLKALKRFGEAWIGIGIFLAIRKFSWIQRGFEALSQMSRPRFLIIVLGLSLALRILWAFITPYQLVSDSGWFMIVSQNILAGKGFSFDGLEPTAVAAPGYPYFLAGISAIFGKGLLSIQLVQSVLDTVILYFIFLIAEKAFGRTVAYLTILFMAFSINQIMVSAMLINEHLLFLGAIPAIYLLIRDLERDSWLGLIGAGILFGISHLARGTFVIFPPLLFFLYLFSGQGWKKAVLKSAFVTLIGIAALLPWTYRNYKILGYPVPVCTSAGYGFYTMNHPKADPYTTQLVEMRVEHPEFLSLHPNKEVAAYLGGSRYAREWILSDPWRFMRLGAGKLISFFGIYSYWSLMENIGYEGTPLKTLEKAFKKLMRYGYIVHFTFFFAGVFILLFKYGLKTFDPKKMLILLLIYFLIGIHFLLTGNKRYRYSIDPFLFMTSAFAIVYLVKKEEISHGLPETIH